MAVTSLNDAFNNEFISNEFIENESIENESIENNAQYVHSRAHTKNDRKA